MSPDRTRERSRSMRREIALCLAGLGALALLGGCRSGGAGGAAEETGGVVAQVTWPEETGNPALQSLSAAAVGPLTAPATVATMRFTVSASDISPSLQQDFAASLGTGTMGSIPVGSSRTLTISGLNSAGTALYTGASSTFSVSANANSIVPVKMAPATGQSVRPWDPPTAVTALAGGDSVTLSWTSAAGATKYNIYWSTTFGVTTASANSITGVISGYIHTGRSSGTTYYYVVTAANSSGETPASSQVSATPSGVTGGTGTGKLTIYQSRNATPPTNIYIDGALVATFYAYWTANFPTTCGGNDLATVTKTVSIGTHNVSAIDSGSLSWASTPISVSSGACSVFQLY